MGKKVTESSVRDELIQCCEREHFAACSRQHFPHVFSTNLKATTVDTGNHLESRLACTFSVVAHGRKV